jgi:ketosteroid isomerase-like protein
MSFRASRGYNGAMSERVENWMNGYRTAWESNDPEDIRALFTEGATYLTAPFREPWRGIDQIVEGWLAVRDEPGDNTFTWFTLGEVGDRVFVQGETAYRDAEKYSNLWVIELREDGRASSFTEWSMDQSDV